MQKNTLKKLWWHTTYGEVVVIEQTYYCKTGTLRPFKLSSGTNTRGYSLPLQRAMTDFGADESFAKARLKIKEHYGIIVPISGERSVTLKHGCAIKHKINQSVMSKNKRSNTSSLLARQGSKFIISETDGSMVPIVVTKNSVKDCRKNKEVMYREARLTLAHPINSTSSIFSATFGDVNTVGKHIRYCVDQAGCGGNSNIHAIGDGAFWIADQVDKQFGSQAKYLVDFYHVSEYLAAASHECATTITPIKWLHAQQQLLKCGKYETVLNNLRNYAVEHEGSNTYTCYHYLYKRTHQLHYAES